MGYYGRLDLKKKAQEMRRLGKSYAEIISQLSIPKATVSDWCRDIQLTEEQLMRLYENKKTGALKGSINGAKKKQAQRLLITEELYKSGLKEIGLLTKREKFIAGIAFYAAEGTKTDKGCCFSNSDPAIIRFMVDWFKEFGLVSMEKFRGSLWLHNGHNELKAKEYWSIVTGIPINLFYKTYIAINKKDSKKIGKNIHEYGVFSFYVSDVMLLRKIKGWIGGIINKPWYNDNVHLHSPVAQR